MKRIGLSLACCAALIVGVLAAASLAGAEVPAAAESATVPTHEVTITSPDSVVTGSGSVLYEPSFFEALRPETSTVRPAASPQSVQEVGCVANFICVYLAEGFNEPYTAIECAFAGNVNLGVGAHSARNKCGNKTNYLRVNGSNISCMNPGVQRGSPPAFNQVYVLANYGAFC